MIGSMLKRDLDVIIPITKWYAIVRRYAVWGFAMADFHRYGHGYAQRQFSTETPLNDIRSPILFRSMGFDFGTTRMGVCYWSGIQEQAQPLDPS